MSHIQNAAVNGFIWGVLMYGVSHIRLTINFLYLLEMVFIVPKCINVPYLKKLQ